MPFDRQTELTLARLAVVLRDRSIWPKGFEWDYGECVSCAMGLVYQLKTGSRLPLRDRAGIHAESMTRRLVDDAAAMSASDFDAIFCGLMVKHHTSDIPPETVAAEIESYLASK